jgi:hypothetical protein
MKMEKEKSKEVEELCCANADTCSIGCSPKSKNKESKCGCEGCCK